MNTAPDVPLWALLAVGRARHAAYLEDTGRIAPVKAPEVKPLPLVAETATDYPEDFDFLALLAE